MKRGTKKVMDYSAFEGFRFWLNDTADQEAIKGWVHQVSNERFTMIANPGQRIVVGDEVACVVTNFGQEIRFIGRVEKQAFGVLLISAARKIRKSDAREPGRLKVNQLQTLVHCGEEYSVRVHDISPTGLGIECSFPLIAGDVSQMVFRTEGAPEDLCLSVRVAHATQLTDFLFRIGLEIVEANRLDDARWRSFLHGGDRIVAPKQRFKARPELPKRKRRRAA